MKSRAIWAVVVATSLLLTVACSDDDDEGASSEGTTETTAADEGSKLSGDPIRLMSITTVGTSGSDLPEIFSAGQAAVAAVNADGGINGRPLELIECNDQFDPNIAAQCARDAVEQGVVAVTGSAGNTADSYFPILEEAGIPLVGSAGQQSAELTSPSSYLITSGTIGEIYGAAVGLIESGRTEIAIAYVDVAAAQFLADGVAETIAASGGEVAAMVPVPFDAADLTPYAAQAIDSGATGIVSIISNQFPLLVQAVSQSGADVVVATPAVGVRPGDLEDLGDAAEGLQLASSFLAPSAAELKVFEEEMDAAGMDDPRGSHALRAWAAVHIVADLLREAETLDAAGLTSAIQAAGPIDFPGLAPFDWAEPIAAFEPLKIFSTEVNLQEVRDGEIVATSDGFIDFLNP